MTSMEVSASDVINAAPARVWDVIRDFNALPNWHPLVAESRIEQGLDPAQVGAVRSFVLKDGGKIREQLLALSDYDYRFTYSIISSPMAVSNYVATIQLLPVTAGDRCYAEWSCTFDCPESESESLAELIGNGVFQAGLDALKERFGD